MANKNGWGAFNIGMRTTKTVLSVGAVFALFEWWQRDPAVLAALSAVYALQPTHQTSIRYGKFRVFGNFIGVCIAIFIAGIGFHFGLMDVSWFKIIGSMFGVLAIIVLCNAFNSSLSIVNSTAAYFVVWLTVPSTDLLDYGLNRVIDTLIGVCIAVLINRLLPQKKN